MQFKLLFRAQLRNLGALTFTGRLKQIRARGLSRSFPKYDAKIVEAFSKTDVLHPKKIALPSWINIGRSPIVAVDEKKESLGAIATVKEAKAQNAKIDESIISEAIQLESLTSKESVEKKENQQEDGYNIDYFVSARRRSWGTSRLEAS